MQKGETQKKDTLDAIKPRTVCIIGCTNCEYVIQGPLLKLVIGMLLLRPLEYHVTIYYSTEGCKDSSITIAGTVISGVVEVINCKGMQLYINKAVPTLQIDGTEGCTVVYQYYSFVTNIFTAKSTEITVGIMDETAHKVECQDGR